MTPKTRPRFWASLWFRVSGGRVVRHRRGSGVTVVFEHVKLRCLLMLPLCYCLKPSFPYSSSSCSYSYDYDHLPLLLQLLLQLLQPSTTTTATTTVLPPPARRRLLLLRPLRSRQRRRRRLLLVVRLLSLQLILCKCGYLLVLLLLQLRLLLLFPRLAVVTWPSRVGMCISRALACLYFCRHTSRSAAYQSKAFSVICLFAHGAA